MTGTYERPVRTLNSFLKSFKDPMAIKDDLIQATVFYFTKITPERMDNIKDVFRLLKATAMKTISKHAKFI